MVCTAILIILFTVRIILWGTRINKSSSSSCHTFGTDTPTLSRHLSRQILRATPHILPELLYVGSSLLPRFRSAIWRSPQKYITYGLVLTSPAVSCMSGSSNLDSFVMGGLWPYSCCFVGCCLEDLFNIAGNILFLQQPLVSVQVVHPYSSIDTIAAFIISVRSDFHMTDSLLIAVNAFVSLMLMSVSVDETRLPT